MKEKIGKYLELILLLLLIVLLVLCISFIRQFNHLRKEVPVNYMARRTVLNADSIQGWMTFDYVNRIFSLPTSYLKSSLNISDEKYPKELIERYAVVRGLNPGDFLKSVQDSVGNYLTNQK